MIYTKNDISKFYSKVVKENLEYGDINIPSMRGTQGADSSVDINLGGGRVRRVLIDTTYDISIGDITVIKVIDFKDTGSNLYWNDRGDVVQSFYFVPIKGSANSKYYMANILDLDHIKTKVRTRYDIKHPIVNWTDIDSKYYPIFKKIVQSFNQLGWKRFDIRRVCVKNYDSKKYYKVIKSNGDSFILVRKGTKFNYTNN